MVWRFDDQGMGQFILKTNPDVDTGSWILLAKSASAYPTKVILFTFRYVIPYDQVPFRKRNTPFSAETSLGSGFATDRAK